MLKNIYRLRPQVTTSAKRSNKLYVRFYSTSNERPVTIELTNKLTDALQREDAEEIQRSVESVKRIEAESSEALKKMFEDTVIQLDPWEAYNQKKKVDASQLTVQDYVEIAIYVKRHCRSYNTAVSHLQTILRDINTQMQFNPELNQAFLRVCNMLMHFYIRSKNLKNAKLVFDGLMVSGRWEGYLEEHSVSVTTILNGIQTLGTRADAYQIVNRLLQHKQMPAHERVYVTLIYTLHRFGDIKGCRYYFAQMKQQGLPVSESLYRAMIQACIDANDSQEILNLFNEMKKQNVEPSIATYTMVLKALNNEKDPNKKNKKLMDQIFEDLMASGADLNVSVFTAMGWDPLQALEEQKRLEVPLRTRDYNACLSHLLKMNRSEEAVNLYRNMAQTGTEMDRFTYGIVMDALLKDDGQSPKVVYDIYDEMIHHGIKPDNVIYTTLLSACGKEKNVDRAISYMEEMATFGLKPNIHNCNSFLTALSMSSKTFYSIRKMRNIWLLMRHIGIQADTRSYNIYLSACYNIMRLERARGREYYQEPQEDDMGLPKMGPCRYMIQSYRAMKEEANPLAQPDFATYTILIKSLAYTGYTRLAMQIYEDAKMDRVKLNVSAYNEIMRGLERSGKMSDIMSIWYDMKMHNVLPDNTSYEIVLEACEQLGLQESLSTIRKQRKSDFDRLWSLSQKQEQKRQKIESELKKAVKNK